MITKSEIKYIQSLAHKKFRDQEGCFVVEGIKMVTELIAHFPHLTIKIFITPDGMIQIGKNLPKNITCVEVQEHELMKLSFLATPQQTLALVKMPQFEQKEPSAAGLTLILDQIQDPGNMGTIIRTCDWFGITNIVCSPDTADVFSPKVVQSSMGSIFRVDVRYEDLDQYIDRLQNIPVYAATLKGESMLDQKFEHPSCLIIGNESKGVSASLLNKANKFISIPKLGEAESLNAAVATGILLSRLLN
ncbi:MAG: TrmH family RNA methyltransferase [Chitinophagia bacterium]